jgi:glycosyltransferase involved in cell wall biosynthesis
LSVGTIEPIKNIIGLIDGFSSNDELKNKFSLVLCGKKGWKSDKIFERIAQAKEEGVSITITGYVSDDVKKCLYENCAAVVLPSFYEGFGMPILEALAYKKPLALSDIEVFHEVAGNAGYYFALNSSKSMSDIILKATRSRTNKNNSPYSKITWEDIANKLLQHFEKISKT